MSSAGVIDSDTHVIEAADLWTSRLPKKWADQTMTVRWSDETQHEMWFVGDHPLKPAWSNVSHKMSVDGDREEVHDEAWAPATLAEAHPASYDPAARSELMTEWGVQLAVLYPNAAGFALEPFLNHPDPEISLAHVRAYNDYLLEEWVGGVPGRYIPIMAVPYWSVPDVVAEIERLQGRGFGGVVMTGAPNVHGQPHLISRHWDPMWRACEEQGLSVSFHVANGGVPAGSVAKDVPEPNAMRSMRGATTVYLENARQTVDLLCSGILPRFPNLKFCISESGIGWVPFILEAVDTRFKRERLDRVMPEFGDKLPSDYLKEQVYLNFWFERLQDWHLEVLGGCDKVLWETDFPHPTGLYYDNIADVYDQALGAQPEEIRKQILCDNPATLYQQALEQLAVTA